MQLYGIANYISFNWVNYISKMPADTSNYIAHVQTSYLIYINC